MPSGLLEVKFPEKVTADVAPPINNLLRDLSLIGTKEELEKADGASALLFGPPQSVAIIEAGVTAATKAWTALFGAGATVGGVVSLVNWGSFTNDALHIAIVAGTALVLAALVIAIALMIGNDIRARGQGAITTIEARASLANRFLTLSRATDPISPEDQLKKALLVAAVVDGGVMVRLDSDAKYQPISGVRLDATEGLQIHVREDWVSVDRVKLFKTL
jgi:hypothetical protein